MKNWVAALLVVWLLCAGALAEPGLIWLPEETALVDSEAFENVPITELVLPEGIQRIESRAFASTGAQYVNLPKSLTYIAPDAFDGCPDLVAQVSAGSYAANWCQANGVTVTRPLDVASRTQEQIRAFVNSHPAPTNLPLIYERSFTADYLDPGRLSDLNMTAALNQLNQLRYIAGLNADVVNAPEWEEPMMAAALACTLNRKPAHAMARPDAWSGSEYDSLYQQARKGGAASNLAAGTGQTPNISLFNYMGDSDSDNITAVGHRRWVLNPSMSKTAFGGYQTPNAMNHYFTGMYAHDMTGRGGQTRIAWPAQQTPVSFFSASHAWSLSLDHAPEADQVAVTLTRKSDERQWHFSTERADGDFYVNDEYCGTAGCVIFRPDDLGSLSAGDSFTVTVRDNSVPAVYRYEVNFFDLNPDPIPEPGKASGFTAQALSDGIRLSWSAASGAEGYYVMRTSPDLMTYGILADVTGTSYTDKTAEVGQRYMYYVYPHTAHTAAGYSEAQEACWLGGDYDGSWGGCGWKLKDGVVTVYPGELGMLPKQAPWQARKDEVTGVVFKDGVIFQENSGSMFMNCDQLTSIRFGNVDSSRVKDTWYMFYGCSGLTELDLSNFITPAAQRLGCMFARCSNLTRLDISGWDTSAVQSFYATFSGCEKLRTLDVRVLNTASATSLNSMFEGCASLTSLNLAHFELSKAQDIGSMFKDCQGLTSLNVSGWDLSAVRSADMIFSGCEKLETLNLTGWQLKANYLDQMFYGCAALKSLDLSGWDTRSAKSMYAFFYYTNNLETLSLGANFSFCGSASGPLCRLGADTLWKSAKDGKTYTGAEMAESRSCIADTYTRVG